MARPASTTIEQFSPELADLLVDQSLRALGKGSSREVMWRCPDHLDDERHVYSAYVGNKTASKDPLRCSICTGKRVVAGINDVATTHPGAAALFVDHALPRQRTAASNKTAEFWCGDDAHEPWSAPISNVVVQGTRCPQCSGRVAVVGADDLAASHPAIAAMLVDPAEAATVKAGTTSRELRWCCPHPGHPDWTATPYDMTTAKTPCPACGNRVVITGVNDLATTHPLVAGQLADPALGQTIRSGSEALVAWSCPKTGHPDWEASPRNRTVAGSGCPTCANKLVVPGVNDLATTEPATAAAMLDPALASTITRGSGVVIQMRCPDVPEHTWETQPYHLTGANPTGCPRCHASSGEKELLAAVRVLVGNDAVLAADRTVLGNGQELDIVLPEHKLALEFNGVYWHSEAAGRGRLYHRDKTRLAANRGYRLIHVWEDDWRNSREQVVRSIAHAVKAVDRVHLVLPGVDPKTAERVMARSLTVNEALPSAAQEFLAVNHLQGRVAASCHFSLVDTDGDIRALLSLRSPRQNARMRRRDGEWEIQRYATLGVVVGGFSRLLAHAERTLRAEGVELARWLSFSDDTTSAGSLYQSTGFVPDKSLAPDYRYVGAVTGWRREPKERFQLKRFREDDALDYRAGWTERQAAAANGLHRVYDAGKTRWTKEL